MPHFQALIFMSVGMVGPFAVLGICIVVVLILLALICWSCTAVGTSF